MKKTLPKPEDAPRTARVNVRVRPDAKAMLGGVAAFLKKTPAQYVRAALGPAIQSDLELISMAMRTKGYSKRRIAREIDEITRGVLKEKPRTKR